MVIEVYIYRKASEAASVLVRSAMETRTNREVIEGALTLTDAVVVDVGCGEGSMDRLLARKGAHVTGIDISAELLDRARGAPVVADERYMEGRAEDLPLDPASADIVIFFNSLHHVDVDGMAKALREAARVLKPGGVLYVAEPLAQGPYFEAMKPVHDETEVRRYAYEALGATDDLFEAVSEFVHVNPMRIESFDAFGKRIVTINPETRSLFEVQAERLRTEFERLGQRTEEGWVFDQPMRVNILRKRAK